MAARRVQLFFEYVERRDSQAVKRQLDLMPSLVHSKNPKVIHKAHVSILNQLPMKFSCKCRMDGRLCTLLLQLVACRLLKNFYKQAAASTWQMQTEICHSMLHLDR
jgi:hypothetical protein